MHSTDILMVVHSRPEYLKLALGTLLKNIDERARVWIWQNGVDPEVRDIVDGFRSSGKVSRYCQSRENAKLREPFNWLLCNSNARYIGKVDDDCLVPSDFLGGLLAVHEAAKDIAVLSAWNYGAEDYNETMAKSKIRKVANQKVILHPWVGGGSFIAKAEPLRRAGVIRNAESFPSYCVRVAWRGWLNGWCVPPMFADHMDDPRSPFTVFKSDADVARFASLTMKEQNVATRADWIQVIQNAAKSVQRGPVRPGKFFLPRMLVRRIEDFRTNVLST